ncbi:FAD-dependent oxidoreductase [Demequina sp. NBRC 110054]|uniref:FAD-dependent oxidoreductase n=1 Tax=Demequina sp. NBRC 110054 TaxID=1570343 RepID=UPI00190EA07D|nr:FAD-dependent oxidoreductase [Demequina sp. NBRC 110054]
MSEQGKRIVIIGSVAAGTSVAAKARRNDETASIVVYEKDRFISYSSCGLPYYVGGEVEELGALTPRSPEWFAGRYQVDMRTGHEVEAVDAEARTLTVRNLDTDEVFTDTYDELVLATGAAPVVPAWPGVDLPGVFPVRNPAHVDRIRQWIVTHDAKKAVVVGAGYIGLEMAEQLVQAGLEVTIVEALDHAMARMDADVSCLVDAEVRKHADLRLATRVQSLHGVESRGVESDGDDAVAGVSVTTPDGPEESIEADVVIVAIGVRPVTALAQQAGAELGASGAIVVDAQMRTSVPHVWAVGDAAESFNLITGEPTWVPLGSTANKMGRIAGDAITGGALEHRGILATGIVRVFDLPVATTGLTEDAARAAGYDVEVIHNIKPDHSEYLGGGKLLIKGVADRATGRLLGAQAVGPGADKRTDVFATAITYGAEAADLFHLDLAYAPPFATTKDPVHYTGMALANAISGVAPLITPGELRRRREAGEAIQVVDVRSPKDHARGAVTGAVSIPLKELRERLTELDPSLPTVTYCNKGVTGNAGQNVLLRSGFADVANLSGGYTTWKTFTDAGL